MIVLNPPAAPTHFDLITQVPEHQAIETALRLARLCFYCSESVGPIEWMRLLPSHEPDTTFIVEVAGSDVSLQIYDAQQAAALDKRQHMIVDGAAGVLDFAAYLVFITPS